MTDTHDTPPAADPAPALQSPSWLARTVAWLGRSAGRVLRSPLVEKLPVRAVRQRELPRLTARCPVLVLENGNESLTLFLAALRGVGLTALGVQRAELALHICRTLPIALLMSDFMRRDTNGLVLRREMLADPELRRIPFVLTAYNIPPELEERTQSYGVLALLTFPISREDVERTVQDALVQHGNWRTPRGFQRDLYDMLRTLDQDAFSVGQDTVRVMRPRR